MARYAYAYSKAKSKAKRNGVERRKLKPGRMDGNRVSKGEPRRTSTKKIERQRMKLERSRGQKTKNKRRENDLYLYTFFCVVFVPGKERTMQIRYVGTVHLSP